MSNEGVKLIASRKIEKLGTLPKDQLIPIEGDEKLYFHQDYAEAPAKPFNQFMSKQVYDLRREAFEKNYPDFHNLTSEIIEHGLAWKPLADAINATDKTTVQQNILNKDVPIINKHGFHNDTYVKAAQEWEALNPHNILPDGLINGMMDFQAGRIPTEDLMGQSHMPAKLQSEGIGL